MAKLRQILFEKPIGKTIDLTGIEERTKLIIGRDNRKSDITLGVIPNKGYVIDEETKEGRINEINMNTSNDLEIRRKLITVSTRFQIYEKMSSIL